MKKLHYGTLLLAAAVSCLALPSTHLLAQGNSGEHGHGHGNNNGQGNDNGYSNGNGYGNGNQGDHGTGDQGDHGNGRGNGHYKHGNQRYFRDQDHDYLVRNYDGPRDLPPGLRKKYYRNGMLPPGWQTRFRPMPPVVIQQLPPVPYGYQRGYYDGYAVVVDPRTRVIYDAIDIVGALSGH